MTETPIASHHATLDLRDHIRGIPDFPKPGILFYDISTLLRHGPAWAAAMSRLGRAIRPYRPDLLAGIESRGFLIAAPTLVAGARWNAPAALASVPTVQPVDHYYLSDFLTDAARPTFALLTVTVNPDGTASFDLPRAEVGAADASDDVAARRAACGVLDAGRKHRHQSQGRRGRRSVAEPSARVCKHRLPPLSLLVITRVF